MSYIIYTYKARYCNAPAAEQLLFVSIEERVFAKTGLCERNKKSQNIERLKCNIMRGTGRRTPRQPGRARCVLLRRAAAAHDMHELPVLLEARRRDQRDLSVRTHNTIARQPAPHTLAAVPCCVYCLPMSM